MNKFENSKKTHFNPLCLDKTEFNNLTNSLKNVEFYFTDLRDGNQSAYYSPSIQSQIEVGILIEKYINAVEGVLEGGYAGATVSEKEKFEALRDKIVLGAFCSSKIKGKDIKEHFSSTLEAKTPVVTIFVKSRLSDVLNTLKITPKENLQNIEENISYLKNSQKQVYVDMEHFFDGYLLNSAYAIETIKSALDGGADKIVLADTLGRTHPRQVRKIILEIFNDKDLSKKLQGKLGLHLHEDKYDTGESILLALSTGHISHVQGNFTRGCGERVGNTGITNLWLTLLEDYGIDVFEKSPDRQKLWGNLIKTYSRVKNILTGSYPDDLDGVLNPKTHCHAAGLHVSSSKKDIESYNIVSQKTMDLLGAYNFPGLTQQAGSANVEYYLEKAGLIDQSHKKNELVGKMLHFIKDKNSLTYTNNLASFLLEAYREKTGAKKGLKRLINEKFGIGSIKTSMMVDDIGKHECTKVSIAQSGDLKNGFHESEKLELTDRINGIFHEIANLLKKKLKEKYDYIDDLELLGYSSIAEEKETNANVLTRLVFRDKSNHLLFSVVSRSKNANIASIDAIKEAFFYFILCKEGEINHVSDPVLESRYGKIQH